MLKIKLARFGKKNQPHYRIVVIEGKSKRDGQYNAALGKYVPTLEPKVLEIDVKSFEAWVTKGAQPTETVQNLFERYKSGNPFPAKKPRLSKKKLAKAAAEKKAAEQPKETTPITAEVAASVKQTAAPKSKTLETATEAATPAEVTPTISVEETKFAKTE